MPATDLGTGALQSGDARAVSIQSAEVETHEEVSERELGHLSESDLAYYTGLLPQKHKGFRYFLNKIPVVWGRMSRD
jgi:hypothetical protein